MAEGLPERVIVKKLSTSTGGVNVAAITLYGVHSPHDLVRNGYSEIWKRTDHKALRQYDVMTMANAPGWVKGEEMGITFNTSPRLTVVLRPALNLTQRLIHHDPSYHPSRPDGHYWALRQCCS
jgi:hypothetical protein